MQRSGEIKGGERLFLVPSCAAHQASQHRAEEGAGGGGVWEGVPGRVLQPLARSGQDTGGRQGKDP